MMETESIQDSPYIEYVVEQESPPESPSKAHDTEAEMEQKEAEDNSSPAEFVIEDTDDTTDSQDQPEPFEDTTVGIMQEAFTVLKNTASFNQKNTKETLCGLLIGEIKIAQKYERYNGKLFGYTEGIGHSPLHEPRKMASKAVIFMVISLTDNWKMPIGLFFVHNPDIKYFADTIDTTLRLLDESGIRIVSITLNCVSPHLSFALAEELGAEINSTKPKQLHKPYFSHPVNAEDTIHILYDIDIILGFLKSYWATERMIYYKKQVIDYSFCVDVKTIDEKELQNYGTDSIYDWIIIRKRISYDTESIGKTIADAIEYLKDLGHPDFLESGPTIKFIRVLDLISKISKVNGQEGELYYNLSVTNATQWRPLVYEIIAYVRNLRSVSKDTPKHLSVFKTYVTGIMVYFTSILDICFPRVKQNKGILPCVLPSRFGLKHIRLGLFENSADTVEPTALSLFKKMKSFTQAIHLVDISSDILS